jgi:hypothetical protein
MQRLWQRKEGRNNGKENRTRNPSGTKATGMDKTYLRRL